MYDALQFFENIVLYQARLKLVLVALPATLPIKAGSEDSKIHLSNECSIAL